MCRFRLCLEVDFGAERERSHLRELSAGFVLTRVDFGVETRVLGDYEGVLNVEIDADALDVLLDRAEQFALDGVSQIANQMKEDRLSDQLTIEDIDPSEFQNRLEELEAANFNKKADPIQTLSKKGGDRGNMTKFEELLAKYGKTAEDITFNYAEMSDEELEAKFAELFADAGTNEPVADDPQKFAKLVRTYDVSYDSLLVNLFYIQT